MPKLLFGSFQYRQIFYTRLGRAQTSRQLESRLVSHPADCRHCNVAVLKHRQHCRERHRALMEMLMRRPCRTTVAWQNVASTSITDDDINISGPYNRIICAGF